MPEPDCFLRYCTDYGTLQPCLGCQRAALLRGILRLENPTYMCWLERAVVLKWFYSLSRRKTFLKGKCAPPSAVLVSKFFSSFMHIFAVVLLDVMSVFIMLAVVLMHGIIAGLAISG